MRIFLGASLFVAIAIVAFAQTGKPSIEGQVVSQTTGAPLSNATVTLVGPGGPRTCQTNEEGRFRFTEVLGGSWKLSAERRGYVPGRYGERKYMPQGGQFSLANDQQMKGVVLRLVPESVIAGRVVDGDGEPIEGARVTVLKLVHAGAVQRWIDSATTLDNGEYRVPRLRAGKYLLRCSVTRVENRIPPPSGVETAFVTTYYPGTTDLEQAAEVQVADGSEVGGINLRMLPSPVFHVRGGLHPATNRSGNAYVALVDKSDPVRVFASMVPARPDYRIDLPRIPPGSYLVMGRWADDTTIAYHAVQELIVKDHDVDNLVLSPTPLGQLTGTIKLDPGGRQVDLKQLWVQIMPVQLQGSREYVFSGIQIGPDLQFRYRIPPADFVYLDIEVSHLPEGCYLRSVRYGGKEVPEGGVEYASDAAVEITVGGDGGLVSGNALNNDGQPFGGAVVTLIPTAPNGKARSVLSGTGGDFRFNSVPPGDYQLLAWDDVSPDDLENPEFVKQFAVQATAVKLEPGGNAAASVRVVAAAAQ